jgi:hypothetical protein
LAECTRRVFRVSQGDLLRNSLAFTGSFLLERVALCLNDKVVAITGRNAFFRNKPESFHATSARHARVSGAIQV